MTCLSLTNFGQIERGELDLGEPLTLLAGRNNQGKSTIVRALQTMTTGNVTPATGQAAHEIGLVCRHGAERGELTFQGGDGPGGKAFTFTKDNLDKISARGGGVDGLPETGEYAAGVTQSLMDMKPAERDAEFWKIFPNNPGRAQLDDWLRKNGTEASSDKIWATVESKEWDGAWKQIKEALPLEKGKWEGVTSERWGADKAEGWVAKPSPASAGSDPDHDPETGEITDEPSIDALKAAAEAADKLVGVTRAKLDQLPKADCNPSHQHKCPDCEALLMIRDGRLFPYKAMPEDELKGLRLAIAEANGKLSNAEGQKRKADQAVVEAQMRVRIETEGEDKRLVETTKKAAGIQAVIARYLMLEKALGPKGVRQECADQVLDDVNQSFAATAASLGLGDAVRIAFAKQAGSRSAAMTVMVGDHSYAALSRSRKWLVRAALQIEIAKATDDAMIILDDADIVVDGRTRGALISTLLGAGIQAVIAMAVAKPDLVLDLADKGVGRSYWIEAGQIMPISEAKARQAKPVASAQAA